ncbi:hypothetical protein [Metabacillus halosaccharovorans]|uniref:hypothetical protein n=1 Tax=Metabacillus halosaccharovorans TaxID=930124 RepID=UPI001C1FE298|nr:hypothetical protein [Metabacillus halosaccharovorans]MBU7594987.1 hypothetical protein [Metabacillus halosaccharovorans]
MSNDKISTLRLRRTSQYINRFRKFKVYIDNTQVHEIGNGEEIVLPIDKGRHELSISVDWVKSEKYEFDIKIGEEVYLLCGSPIKGAKLLIPFIPLIGSFVPNWYLFIKEV